MGDLCVIHARPECGNTLLQLVGGVLQNSRAMKLIPPAPKGPHLALDPLDCVAFRQLHAGIVGMCDQLELFSFITVGVVRFCGKRKSRQFRKSWRISYGFERILSKDPSNSIRIQSVIKSHLLAWRLVSKQTQQKILNAMKWSAQRVGGTPQIRTYIYYCANFPRGHSVLK